MREKEERVCVLGEGRKGRFKLRSSMSSVQLAAEVHMHQYSIAHVAHSGHLDASAVLAHGSPQLQLDAALR